LKSGAHFLGTRGLIPKKKIHIVEIQNVWGHGLLQKASYKWVLILLFISFSALTKSTGLRTDGKIDERSFWINYVSSLSAPLAIPLVYPRMLAIHDLDSKV
jgi:hypothetical protein